MRRVKFVYMMTVITALCLALIFTLASGLTNGERMVMEALGHLDKPYVFNTRGPDKFDCSGLILYCAEKEGLGDLPHAAEELYSLGRPVAKSMLLPGDMVCFDTVRDKDPCDHVGFYMGGNRFVHASSSKKKVVVTELSDKYLEKYSGARRLGCAYF